MRTVPAIVHRFRSAAERRLFGILELVDLGPSWIALHSLNVSRHARKRWSEIDFVLVGPEGVFALEVKGGRVACVDGIWHFTDRYDEKHRRSEGPFEQAKTGLFALRDLIRDEGPRHAVRRAVFGWGVVFPDIDFALNGPEMPPQIVCDRDDVASSNALKQYLNRLVSYWKNKEQGAPRILDPADVDTVLQFLRPQFDLVPTLSAQAANVEVEVVRLTEDQYRMIDAVQAAPRILCVGGAGTGKSFLAAETSRREAANGADVLLVAGGETFSAFMAATVNEKAVTVLPFSAISTSAALRAGRRFDVLVVDEGQDFLNLESLDVFDRTLRHGLEDGRWRWFMDANNQSGLWSEREAEAEEMLRSYSPVPVELRHNCRNTPEIILQTQQATGADIGKAEIRGAGPPVHYESVSGNESAARALEAVIHDWHDEGATNADIAVLSPLSFSESCVSLLPESLRRSFRDLDSDPDAVLGTSMIFSSVRGFKGFERKFVAIIDTGALDSKPHSVAQLYVAMTRSHAVLWVALDEGFRNVFAQFRRANQLKILKLEGDR